MKKFIQKLLFAIALAATGHLGMAQTLITVNNNPGAPTGTNVYTDFATAQAAAANGDIIYLVPSSTNYGALTVTKELTIFGAGMIPDKDLGTKTFVTNLFIDASNVRVSGLIGTLEWRLASSISSTTISNITIENCRFPGLRHYTSSVTVGNLLIRNNVITIVSSYTIDLQTTASVIITNNIINSYCCSSSYGLFADGVTFSHNIFRYEGINGNDGSTIDEIDNCLLEYNIFYGTPPSFPDGASSGNTFNYNLSYGSSDNSFSGIGSNGNTGTGNVVSSDPMFTNLPLGSGWSDSYDPSLQAGSQADDIDSSGGQAGVYGGATPWDPDGSLLPTVQTITIPSVIPVGSDLDVNVTGKGN